MIPSGILNGDGDFASDGFDIGRVAIGQGGLEGQSAPARCRWRWWRRRSATTGSLMQPRLTDRVVRKDGRVKERIQPDLQSQVIKPETADAARAR